MRNILIVFGILLCSLLPGQSKVIQGDVQIDNTSYIDMRDTTRKVSSAVETMQEDITTLSGRSWIITDNGDSIRFWSGPNVVKIATGSSTIQDVVSPTFTSAEIGNVADDSIFIVFSESVLKDSVPAVGSFEILVDGVENVVTGIAMGSENMRLGLTSALTGGELVYGEYTSPNTDKIQDAAGNYLKSTPFTIVNNTDCDQLNAYCHFIFEHNTSDQQGNVIMTNNAAYADDGNVIQGNFSAHLNSANYNFQLSEFDWGNLFTIEIRFRIWFGTANERTLVSWLDVDGNGLEIRYDRANDIIEVETGDGTNTTIATSSVINYPSNEARHVAVTVDRLAGSCKIYYEGLDVTNSGSIENDFDTSDTVTVGLRKDLSGEMYGYADDFIGYKDTLSAANVLADRNSQGSSITVGDCDDDPIPNDSINTIFSLTFDSAPIKGDLTISDLQATSPNHKSLSGELPPYVADDAEFIVVMADTLLRSIYRQDQCCSETTDNGAYGGTGIAWNLWIDQNQADYFHGYLRFRIKFAPGFDCGDGGKLLRLRSIETHGHINYNLTYPRDECFECDGSNFGLMFSEETEQGIPIHWYNYVHQWGGGFNHPYGLATGGDFYTLSTGVWHEIVMRWYSGTSYNKDGFIEVFVDDIFVHSVTGIMFRELDYIGMNIIEISTFAGGSTLSHYRIPYDTWIDISRVELFQYKEGVTGPGNEVPAYDVPSSSGRVLDLPAW